MERQVHRRIFRAQLCSESPTELAKALDQAKHDCRHLLDSGRAMVAGLFRYGRGLFCYYEAVGEPLAPEDFFGALSPLLLDWPGRDAPRKWAYMTPAYFHAEPLGEADWTRRINTGGCSGRLAYLKEDMIADYLHSHKALTNEGALLGDKYTLIAQHEDVLFQYMEQREVLTNVSRDPELVCRYLGPEEPGRPRIPPDSWLYPNGVPFAMMPDGGRFTPAEKLFVEARESV